MRPQVVAHRGASDEHAEHTLGAYLAAVDQGTDAVECDVRLTRDGHLVCVHDRDLLRTTGHPGVVSTTELSDLVELDFAAWKRPSGKGESPDWDPERDGVLTLRRLLHALAACERRVEVAIETKHPTRHAGRVEQRLVELLGELDWLGPDSPVRVMSFSYVALRRLRRLAPHLRLVMLFEHARRWPLIRPFVDPDWIAGPDVATLRRNPGFAQALVASGREVHAWTVNSEEDLQACLDGGVRAVITDRPGRIVELLDHAVPDASTTG